jgi:hypothetical protein
MNAQEILQILGALKSGGASHFKSQAFEVTFNGQPENASNPPPPAMDSDPVIPTHAGTIHDQKPQGDLPEREQFQEIVKTLSLPPEKLMDLIFPAGAEG